MNENSSKQLINKKIRQNEQQIFSSHLLPILLFYRQRNNIFIPILPTASVHFESRTI